ncbi:MAG TPA: family 16 glycoside hydrolase [Armatimonadota bacterium]|nr:family 16 glycoside hydrolase [Armatimonadota bacterium]
MPRLLLLSIALVVLVAGSCYAQDVLIGAAPGIHGVVFQTGDGPPVVIQIGATSLGIDEAQIPGVPAGIGVDEDVEEGSYNRVEWDKGGFLRDGFSTRWTGTVGIEAEAEYTFYASSDDGARVKVDGETIIDEWVPRPKATTEGKVTLSAGDHEVICEYFEGGGAAVCQLEWSAEGLDREIIPEDRVSADGQPGWRAEYFVGTELEGEPIITEQAETIDYEWGNAGPMISPEEPGNVGFDWTRISPTAIAGRINAGPNTQIGVLASGAGAGGGQTVDVKFNVHDADIPIREIAGARFGLRILDPATDYERNAEEGSFWCRPTDTSVVFVAGFIPVSFMSADECRQAISDAFAATVKPDLPTSPADEDGWIALLEDESADGWSFRGNNSHWVAADGELDNQGHGGSDVLTESTFLDCDLHIEFKHPKGSNSGVYMQGRYELQVIDSHGGELWGGSCGAIYHIADPAVDATKPAGEWNSFDIDFTSATVDMDGRVVPARMTVKHNDMLTYDDCGVPRATGGELNRNYLTPGPVMLQGTHGLVTYRNIKVRPK